MEIRKLLDTDWQQVRLIYEKGINTGNATFQTTTPTWEDWNNSHLALVELLPKVMIYLQAGQHLLLFLHDVFMRA